jgi:hypothetical protein
VHAILGLRRDDHLGVVPADPQPTADPLSCEANDCIRRVLPQNPECSADANDDDHAIVTDKAGLPVDSSARKS